MDIPAGTELEVWEQQVVDGIAQEIMDNFQIESWRLFVDLSVQEEEGYTVHVRVCCCCLFVYLFVIVLIVVI